MKVGVNVGVNILGDICSRDVLKRDLESLLWSCAAKVFPFQRRGVAVYAFLLDLVKCTIVCVCSSSVIADMKWDSDLWNET